MSSKSRKTRAQSSEMGLLGLNISALGSRFGFQLARQADLLN